jgi:hypothetical protein
MSTPVHTQDRFNLITRRLQEVLGGDTIQNLLKDGKTPKCYWGAVSVSAWILLIYHACCAVWQERHLLEDVNSFIFAAVLGVHPGF